MRFQDIRVEGKGNADFYGNREKDGDGTMLGLHVHPASAMHFQ